MKLSDYVAKFLSDQGLRHIFGVNGGANLHLIHSVYETENISFIPSTHETCAGFAADAYARITGLGCAMATSGPGATNLITAIATSYYDSSPVIYITGAVATHRQSERYGVRQYGFQDTPIVDIVYGITVWAQQLKHAREIRRLMADAVHYAKTQRKGPVLIDIPDDLQRAEI